MKHLKKSVDGSVSLLPEKTKFFERLKSDSLRKRNYSILLALVLSFMFVEVKAQPSTFDALGTPVSGTSPVNISNPGSTAGVLNVNGGVVFENLGGLTSNNFLNLDANNEVGTVFGYLAPTGGVVGSMLYWNSASWVVNDDIRMSSGDIELGDASFTNDGTLTIFNNVGGSGGNVI